MRTTSVSALLRAISASNESIIEAEDFVYHFPKSVSFLEHANRGKHHTPPMSQQICERCCLSSQPRNLYAPELFSLCLLLPILRPWGNPPRWVSSARPEIISWQIATTSYPLALAYSCNSKVCRSVSCLSVENANENCNWHLCLFVDLHTRIKQYCVLKINCFREHSAETFRVFLKEKVAKKLEREFLNTLSYFWQRKADQF